MNLDKAGESTIFIFTVSSQFATYITNKLPLQRFFETIVYLPKSKLKKAKLTTGISTPTDAIVFYLEHMCPVSTNSIRSTRS